MEKIPEHLITQIREGKTVLFLGAGASIGATDTGGSSPPSGKQLGIMIADRYLGGKFKDRPLRSIADLAINVADLTDVQEYIREIFEPFSPTETHIVSTEYCWHGVATTNYDRLIEEAYQKNKKSPQTPVPYIDDGDRIEEKLRDQRNVLLIKLHGCISRTSTYPIVLSTEQIIRHKKGRKRLYNRFYDWASERTILFIGHRLDDYDLVEIITEVMNELGEKKPRYYAVIPEYHDEEKSLWESRKVTLIKGTFEGFFGELGKSIRKELRILAAAKKIEEHQIFENFRVRDVILSPNCQLFLDSDVDYVKSINVTEVLSPRDFYRGINKEWSAIEQNLDIRRSICETIISENILIEESDHLKLPELVLIKAHAGAGKTIALRRLAWDASRDYDSICLYVRSHGMINTSAIKELIGNCGKRIFLFIDNAADRIKEILHLMNHIGVEGALLTVIVAERINEWNVACADLAPFVTSEYELRYLSEREVDALIGVLEKHDSLGTLKTLDVSDRRKELSEKAGRQLLVALHEATHGMPFEDIIEDEYRKIQPIDAQKIYLTVCILNRLNVPVRAGVISRIHGVPFIDFQRRFHGPLEKIVITRYDNVFRDYNYSARHPYIADIVFDRALQAQDERYDAYLKCVKSLNLDYSSDNRAFRRMVAGRTLLELFPRHELVEHIYNAAKEQAGNDAYLFHQMAIYEINRADGNMNKAAELLSDANKLAPKDMSIIHSMAEHCLRKSEIARTQLERNKLLSDAAALAYTLIEGDTKSSHAYHTLVKIELIKLKDVINDGSDATQEEIEDVVKSAEAVLYSAQQRYPGDAYLLSAESKLAELLSDSNRAILALERAFHTNPRNPFYALRLSSHYKKKDESQKAIDVLKKAIESNRGEKRLHFAYAKLTIDMGGDSDVDLEYHLKRSFTKGDSNYEAQILYGRQLFIDGEYDESKLIFDNLETVPISPDIRYKLLYPCPSEYKGKIVRRETSYAFIERHGPNDRIYVYSNNVHPDIWRDLKEDQMVSFKIAFNFRGANAFDVKRAE